MSDAKQLFIDEVMRRACRIAVTNDPDTYADAKYALLHFLQERICEHDVKGIEGGLLVSFYRLDGGRKGE